MKEDDIILLVLVLDVVCFIGFVVYSMYVDYKKEKRRKLDFTVFRQNIFPGNYYMINDRIVENNPFKASIDNFSYIYKVDDVRTSPDGSKWASGYFLDSENNNVKVYEEDIDLFDNFTQVYHTDDPDIIYKDLVEEIKDNLHRKPDEIRYGQFVFNYIETKYRLGYRVKEEKGIDCYYVDRNVEKFLYNVALMIKEWYTKNNTLLKEKAN